MYIVAQHRIKDPARFWSLKPGRAWSPKHSRRPIRATTRPKASVSGSRTRSTPSATPSTRLSETLPRTRTSRSTLESRVGLPERATTSVCAAGSTPLLSRKAIEPARMPSWRMAIRGARLRCRRATALAEMRECLGRAPGGSSRPWRGLSSRGRLWTRASISSPSEDIRSAISSTAEASSVAPVALFARHRRAHEAPAAGCRRRGEYRDPRSRARCRGRSSSRSAVAGSGLEEVPTRPSRPCSRSSIATSEDTLRLVDAPQMSLSERKHARPLRESGARCSARVVSERRICPPWPTVQMRAARTTSRPT